MAKKQFKAESKRLLDLMIHSIYSNREIFLRELISNASDAIDKRCYLSLTNDKLAIDRSSLSIRIAVDKENRTLTVSDDGIGMNQDSMEENLGIIAHSGSLKFKDEMKSVEDTAEDIDIIGQFGVGFYSAFMVSEKITVISRPNGSDTAFRWESTGADGYTIEECYRDSVGTDIIMTLKPDEEEEDYSRYLNEYTLRSLVKKYSDYIRYPIRMDVEKRRPIEKPDTSDSESDDDAPKYETYIENETLNDMVPLWKKSKNDITDEQHKQFYKEKFHEFDDPALSFKVETEGVISYEALLYVPSRTPYNYFTKEYEKGLQLYSSGVLIMEKCADLLPEHFRFVKGVVDSDDLSLNISREILQQNRQLQVIASSIEKKIKRELMKLLENDREKYEEFFKNFGIQLKYSVAGDYSTNKDSLKDLLLFYSSTEQKPVTFAEYISRMKEEQKIIYYACGETVTKIDKMPQTEVWKDKGYEILYLTDEVDDFVMKMLREIDGKEIKSVNSDDLVDEDMKKEAEENTKTHKELLDFMKETLTDKVKDVKVSEKLKSHPVCLSSDGAISLEMEKYFAQMQGQDERKMQAERVLEVNVSHPVFAKLEAAYGSDKDKAAKLTTVLYQQAVLIAGFSIDDPTEYTDMVCSLM